MRRISDRKLIGNHAGILLQIHVAEIWRGTTDFPDGAFASSLPEKRVSRGKNRNPLLDIGSYPGNTDHCYLKNKIVWQQYQHITIRSKVELRCWVLARAALERLYLPRKKDLTFGCRTAEKLPTTTRRNYRKRAYPTKKGHTVNQKYWNPIW